MTGRYPREAPMGGRKREQVERVDGSEDELMDREGSARSAARDSDDRHYWTGAAQPAFQCHGCLIMYFVRFDR